MGTMTLVAIRSTAQGNGLVAILVEDGGSGVLAVPVSAREGIVLSAPDIAPLPTWPSLITRVCRTWGGRAERVVLDVDDDARICGAVVLTEIQGRPDEAWVPCAPSDGLILAEVLSVPITASKALLRLRQEDLGDEALSDRLVAWRAELTQATSADANPT